MNTKILIILIIVIVLGASGFFVYQNVFVSEEKALEKDIPDTSINEICLKISRPDDTYYCLAVTNQDISFCQNLDEPDQKKLCQGMAARDVSYCREIQESGAKKMCYYELSFLTGEFDYCDEAADPNDCYFAFIHRLHWESRADEIKKEYCDKLNTDAPEELLLKNCCLAFKEQNSSLCQGNKYCLSFFKQPLSFCDTGFQTPEGTFKHRDDCLVDRAMSEKDSSICAEINDDEVRDMCYGNMSTHISPDVSICEKTTDEMRKNMCYAEVAMYLAQEKSTTSESDESAGETFDAAGEIVEEKSKTEEPDEQEAEQKTEPEPEPEEELIPSAYHIENPPYYREDGFCWGGSAIMLMMDHGLTEIEGVRAAMKSGLGGTPDMFRGFVEFGVVDKIRIAYSKNYIEEFADFYNRQILVRPEEQVILLDDQADALNQLKELISSDVLVIADVHYGNHFVVVTGYDEFYIYINDPGLDDGYDYEKGYYEEQSKISIDQFLKEWGISKQYKSMSDMEGAIGFPGDYGMIWLEKQ